VGGRLFPWGDHISCEYANFLNCSGDTTAAGKYTKGVSPFRTFDMAGNVWEWVADRYDPSYYTQSPELNPLGPSTGQLHGLRGGSWNKPETQVRTTFRVGLTPGYSSDDIGFRCAENANSK
jgi:iron(II)-dependent oxidoreductase